MRLRLANFVGFQIGWFACVLSAARGHVWVGPAAALALLSVHFLVIGGRSQEFVLVATVGALGTALDTGMASFGVLRYEATWLPWLCPPWIIALWLLLAATFNHSFSWLAGRPWLAFVLGAVGGPLSYAAGARFGALSFGTDTVWSIVVTSVVWGAALPSSLAFAGGLRRRMTAAGPALDRG